MSSLKRLLLISIFFLLGVGLGVGRMLWSTSHTTQYDDKVGGRVELKGTIVSQPDVRETGAHLIFKPDDSDVNILIFAGRYPQYRYSDKIKVAGTLKLPENFVTDSGVIFDYQNYLAKDDIYYQLMRPEIVLLDRRSSFRGMLFSIQEQFLANLNRALPEPEAALAGGVVIGAKQGLDAETTAQFRAVGLSHVIVLSGYNITIVAETVMRFLNRLPIFYGAGLGAVSIVLFILMTGASTTAVRAGIMALVALLGKVTGRPYDSLRALWVAGIGMVLWNPRILVFDLSFQLSFLATLGVIVGSPILNQKLVRIPERFGLRETLATTVAAQSLVLPWILYKMGQLSLVALPVNLLVLPLMPATMLWGALAGLPVLPLAWLAYLPLHFIIVVARLFAALPFASVSIPNLPLWLVAGAYSLLGILYYRWRLSKSTGAGL